MPDVYPISWCGHSAADPCLPVQTAEGLLAAQIEADNEITVEYEGMPMLVKVQHVYSVDAHSNISSGRRIRDPSQWKSNKRKHQRNSGLEYTTRSGKTVKARAMKPGCNSKCRYKCHDKFPGTDRQAIFEQFWGLGCLSAQRNFCGQTCHQNTKESKTHFVKEAVL